MKSFDISQPFTLPVLDKTIPQLLHKTGLYINDRIKEKLLIEYTQWKTPGVCAYRVLRKPPRQNEAWIHAMAQEYSSRMANPFEYLSFFAGLGSYAFKWDFMVCARSSVEGVAPSFAFKNKHRYLTPLHEKVLRTNRMHILLIHQLFPDTI